MLSMSTLSTMIKRRFNEVASRQNGQRGLDSVMMSSMPTDRRKSLVLVAAIVLRILVFAFFPQLPDLLVGQVEVSTPVNSFKRCKDYAQI